MIVLDTDIITLLQNEAASASRVVAAQLDAFHDELAATIISVEEQMRGWLALLARRRQPKKQIWAYDHLAGLFSFYSEWPILLWTNESADIFESLRKSRIRIGTMDLKIASVALANGARVVTRNLRDFQQVPGLTVVTID